MFAYNVLKMGDSHVYTTVDSLRKKLDSHAENAKIGFVPTMGALHHGHISLVKQAMESCEIVVVSIFVNPTQFNNSEDLIKYPRTLEKDVELLNSAGEIVVFAPNIEDVYPANFENIHVELGDLGTVMEGKFRPGHFNGVMNVVKRLFDIVKPDRAFFGLKDFQQLAVVKFMTKSLNLPVEIVACEIVREPSGLASSSRNMRLSDEHKTEALALYNCLMLAKQLSAECSPRKARKKARKAFKQSGLVLEYLEIVDPTTLQPLRKEWVPGANACIAAMCGEVRLIDNLQLVPFDEK